MTHRIAFLVLDGVTLLDVSGPLEVLHQAGRLGHPYTCALVSPRGGDVTTSSGPVLAGTTAAADAGPVDTLVVAGADHLADQGSRRNWRASAPASTWRWRWRW